MKPFLARNFANKIQKFHECDISMKDGKSLLLKMNNNSREEWGNLCEKIASNKKSAIIFFLR